LINKIHINSTINYLVVAYAFILPLSRAGIVAFTALLFILWIIEGKFRDKFRQIFKCKFTLSLIIFLIFSTLSLLWAQEQNLKEGINYIRKYWYLLILFPIFTSLKHEYIPKILYAFLAGMSVSVIISWGIYFDWWQVKEVTAGSLSPFMYHVFYSIFLAFSSLLALNFALNSKDKRVIFLHIFLAILFTGILFLGIGRTGQVILVVGIFLLLINNFKHKIRAISIALILSTILIGTFYTFNDTFKQRINFIKSDIVQTLVEENYCNSLGGRAFTWVITYEIVKEHPIIGIGLGDHLEYLRDTMDSDERFSTCHLKNMIVYFHGQYIEIVAQIGLLGLISFLAIFYFLMSISIKNNIINNIKIILIMTFLLVFFVDVPFRKQFSLALFALMSGIIIRQKIQEDKSNKIGKHNA